MKIQIFFWVDWRFLVQISLKTQRFTPSKRCLFLGYNFHSPLSWNLLNLADTWPAATRVLSRGRERSLGTRLRMLRLYFCTICKLILLFLISVQSQWRWLIVQAVERLLEGKITSFIKKTRFLIGNAITFLCWGYLRSFFLCRKVLT